MGMFLSLSGIINQPASEVTRSLTTYLSNKGGGLEKAELSSDHSNFCVVEESNGNTTVMYPYGFSEGMSVLNSYLLS